MAGGPMVNIAIAFFLFWGVFATVGQIVDAKAEPVVAEVVPCIVPADEDGRVCTAEELKDNPTPPLLPPVFGRATGSSPSTANPSRTGPRSRRRSGPTPAVRRRSWWSATASR